MIENEYLKNLDRIEFVVTMACSGNCRHCSEGDHAGYTEHIDPDTAVKAVREICAHYRIRTLMTFGGEALLFPDTVFRIHQAGTALGIPRRQLITNGYFSRTGGGSKKSPGTSRKAASTTCFCRLTLSIRKPYRSSRS